MKIEAKISNLNGRYPNGRSIDLSFHGAGGDDKQPVNTVYLNVCITPKSARELARKLIALTQDFKPSELAKGA